MKRHTLLFAMLLSMVLSLPLPAETPTPSAPISDVTTTAKLKVIKIPRVSFSGVPLGKVLVTLEEMSKQYDPDGVGVKIVLQNAPNPEPLVTITLRSLSLEKILDFVTESVGHQYLVKDGIIVVKPRAPIPHVMRPSRDYSAGADPFSAPPARASGASDSFAPPPSSRQADGFATSSVNFSSIAAGYGGKAAEFNTEGYDLIYDNTFRSPLNAPLSTFSIDVDTASFANVRRFLNQGKMPPPDAVRVEELINYFPYAYAPPPMKPGASPEETDITKLVEQPFAVYTEVGPAPWAPMHSLVKIGLKGYDIDWSKRPPANLVFLLDVSGSMNSPNKLPLVVDSLSKLVRRLDGRDRVAIVVYAGASGLVLPSTTANNQETILHALEQLRAGGSTNGGQGIELAYAQAKANFIEDGANRVILCTDGDFNVGITDKGQLTSLVEARAKEGVFLTVLGFGGGNYKDDMLETLSNKGNGNYAYIDSEQEARKVFNREAAGSLLTIAKDVKIQVEFNPALVKAYRLIGYENRVLKDEDFNNDKVDAGELGSGHTVTALYEIVPPGVEIELSEVDKLKYQQNSAPDGPANELMTVKLRYKWPKEDESILLDVVVAPNDQEFAACSDDFRFVAAVAGWGMLLRDSEYKGDLTYDWVESTAINATGQDPGGFRDAFTGLVTKSREVSAK